LRDLLWMTLDTFRPTLSRFRQRVMRDSRANGLSLIGLNELSTMGLRHPQKRPRRIVQGRRLHKALKVIQKRRTSFDQRFAAAAFPPRDGGPARHASSRSYPTAAESREDRPSLPPPPPQTGIPASRVKPSQGHSLSFATVLSVNSRCLAGRNGYRSRLEGKRCKV
jgi:hypothetical protein